MPLIVKEIMSQPVYTIDQNKTARDAAILLRKIRRGFLVVTSKKKPVGVLSDSDLIKHVIAANKQAAKVKVKDIMTRHFVSITPDADVLAAVRKMKKGNVHRLPVIDEGKLVGVISLSDIAKTSPEMLNLLETRLQMKEEPLETKAEHTSGICDNCDNFSDDLVEKNGQWLCEDCREEAESEK